MTEKRLNELIDYQKTMDSFPKIIEAIQNKEIIAFCTPYLDISLPAASYDAFREFILVQIDKAKKEFEGEPT